LTAGNSMRKKQTKL